MKDITISDAIRYVGVDDKTIDLFEGQYVVPKGVSYNSYVILDEKIVVMDTVDKRAVEQWLCNLEQALDGRKPDYLVVSHMEPDHASGIQVLAEKFPDMRIIASVKAVTMMGQFFTLDFEGRTMAVKEGDTLCLGEHTLSFVMAPMVHWPEVMVTYEESEKILFSADGFGTFGALEAGEEWISQARRYFFNIVGKYGAPVQTLLKKASGLDIRMICPLHGPVLKENLGYYLDKYHVWSSYQPEEEGVLVAYASIYGNTAAAANRMAELLKEKGAKNVTVMDLARNDMADAVENAFRYSRMVVAAASYDGFVFPPMDSFLKKLTMKAYQNRRVAVIENGTWAPSAGKCMKAALEAMKNVEICEKMVTIRSAVKPEDEEAMAALAEELLA